MDFDDNGWQDLYITRYGQNDILFKNTEGHFQRVDNPLGLDTNNGGNASVWADFDNDGDKDMIVAVVDEKRRLDDQEQIRFDRRNIRHARVAIGRPIRTHRSAPLVPFARFLQDRSRIEKRNAGKFEFAPFKIDCISAESKRSFRIRIQTTADEKSPLGFRPNPPSAVQGD